VMTFHKAKGLGFDVVILPDIPNDGIPSSQHFNVAEGDGWITQTPPEWARSLIPEIRIAENRWAANQCYEAFCMLYVALTRAKYGLYILLEPPAKSQEIDNPSLANWLVRSLASDMTEGVIYQSGSTGWMDRVPLSSRTEVLEKIPTLAAATPHRERLSPSREKHIITTSTTRSNGGAQFGSNVHAAFENVGWVDEDPPFLPNNEAGNLIADLLKIPSVRKKFERNNRLVELYREQPMDGIIGGKWLSGVVDRLHLHRDAAGKVTHVEIIDYKTDAVIEIGALVTQYSIQMQAYRQVMAKAYPEACIDLILLSTHCRSWIAF
jgi:ATP-dependent helicase/nuclease subunit A